MLTRSVFKNKTKLARLFSTENLQRTSLYNWHIEKGGKIVPFAGYELPVQYKDGLMKEHLHCRQSSSLFDVSHMGQVKIHGKDRHEFIERITVVDTQTLKPGEGSLSLITNEKGGIKDDTVITINKDHIYMVVNAACKHKDLAHMEDVRSSEFKSKDVSIETLDGRSLLAIQGPKTHILLEKLFECSLKDQLFMTSKIRDIPKLNTKVIATRCGYTGEDGFELSVVHEKAVDLANLLLEITDDSGTPFAAPCGLGARDSLRLEAGLCLYGHEMDEEVSPVEAVLQWTISKRRKDEGGFIGYEGYQEKRKKGAVKQKRVGFEFTGKGPAARDGTEIFDSEGKLVGKVTSGSFGPSVSKNIGMAYVDNKYTKAGNELQVKVRERLFPIVVAKMPLIEPGYYRG
jgi:aminomethyltransferase